MKHYGLAGVVEGATKRSGTSPAPLAVTMWSWPVTRSILVTVPSAATCISKRAKGAGAVLVSSFQRAPATNATAITSAPSMPPAIAFTGLVYHPPKTGNKWK